MRVIARRNWCNQYSLPIAGPMNENHNETVTIPDEHVWIA
jgi:hypothetical protein